MTGLALVLLLQARAPTVGDTVWLERTVAVAAASRLEPRRLEGREGEFDPLGAPAIARAGGRATLRWPVVFWTTGRHEVDLPAVLVTGPDGSVDSVPPLTAAVEIASVLPPVARESTLGPQPPAAVVPVRRRAWWPGLVALLAAAGGGWLLWRRWTSRGAAPGAPAAAAAAPPPVARWAAAGEVRAVAHSAAARLRAAVAAACPPANEGLDTERCLRLLADQRPAWPLDELARCLRRLDVLRFGPDDTGVEPFALWTEAEALATRLEAGAR
ncbi:MAG TPA: hypothetical protein VLA95_09855 [Gemmatimonadales bacterium]|nr:hypothetical protein [Gemmatimonadales bacterium]